VQIVCVWSSWSRLLARRWVTHSSTNRARRGLTSFVRRTPLTTTPCLQRLQRVSREGPRRATTVCRRRAGWMVGRVMASVASVTSRLFRRPSIDSSAPQRDVLAPDFAAETRPGHVTASGAGSTVSARPRPRPQDQHGRERTQLGIIISIAGRYWHFCRVAGNTV